MKDCLGKYYPSGKPISKKIMYKFKEEMKKLKVKDNLIDEVKDE